MFKLLALMAGAVVIPAAMAAAAPLPNSAALFGARERIQQIDISPDGQRVSYLTPGPGATTLLVVQPLQGEAQVVTRSTGSPDRLRWCNFVTNDRLICRASFMMTEGTQLVPYNRMFAIDADGGNVKQLGQQNTGHELRKRQYDGSIIDWLPGQDAVVLIARDYIPDGNGTAETRMLRKTNGLQVDRVDVRTLRSTPVERADERAGAYLSDGRGNVRIRAVPAVNGSTGQLRNRVDYFYRAKGGNDWRPLGSDDDSDSGIKPLAVDPELNAVYVLRKLNGRQALYRIKLDGSLASELVHAHDRVDVDDVVRVSHGSRIIGVTFAEEKRRVVYFDPEFGRLAEQLGRAIPNLPLVDFVGASADNQRLLIHAGSDADPGRYFVFDRAKKNLNEITLARPELENVPLARVQAVSYPAGNGVNIPAYLTLPPGGTGKNLPTVVLPHGGPSARDEWGFDWLAQYFAHQGYAVLQPNYRGSAGFGDAWMQRNGFQGWETSIGDVTAGARWLTSQGIADPARTAIVGWSYGGYAALQAGVTEPDLFKAIVAIAPVTDLSQLREDSRGYTNYDLMSRYIGTGPHLRQGSPLPNASRIKAPVMLFHGTRDLNVRVVHSRRMNEALREAGKQSELTIFEGLEHSLDDTTARTQMLAKIGDFLRLKIGR